MRKFKVLQTFQSVYMGCVEGQIVPDHNLDDYTIDNWVENGLIEEIIEKKSSEKVVTDVENESSDNH
jgi:hypothetical protein